jgi:thioredoxin 1
MQYSAEAPSREEIDSLEGPVLLQFGTDWCGHCQAAEGAVRDALSKHPQVRHLLIEDGKGRPLGRSFAVKLWPTLIFLLKGQEVGRLVRPTNSVEIEQELQHLLMRPEKT